MRHCIRGHYHHNQNQRHHTKGGPGPYEGRGVVDGAARFPVTAAAATAQPPAPHEVVPRLVDGGLAMSSGSWVELCVRWLGRDLAAAVAGGAGSPCTSSRGRSSVSSSSAGYAPLPSRRKHQQTAALGTAGAQRHYESIVNAGSSIIYCSARGDPDEPGAGQPSIHLPVNSGSQVRCSPNMCLSFSTAALVLIHIYMFH